MAVLKRFGVHHRDGDRGVLKIGLALGGGHDDVVEAHRRIGDGRQSGRRRRGLGEGGNGCGEKRGPQHQLEPQFVLTVHFYPLLGRAGDYAAFAMCSSQPRDTEMQV
nr:hypothetical protein [uncultured Brevundimonas sp.]